MSARQATRQEQAQTLCLVCCANSVSYYTQNGREPTLYCICRVRDSFKFCVNSDIRFSGIDDGIHQLHLTHTEKHRKPGYRVNKVEYHRQLVVCQCSSVIRFASLNNESQATGDINITREVV